MVIEYGLLILRLRHINKCMGNARQVLEMLPAGVQYAKLYDTKCDKRYA